MKQYIPKDALVAEIENIRKHYIEKDFDNGWNFALYKILYFIDTLEVKEVDLEKELDAMITPELKSHKALPSLFDVAKHFFELGFMHTLSWKDIRLIAEIGEEFMYSEESDAYTNEESYYNAILNKLKEKGLDYKTQRQEIRDIKAQK